MHLTTLMIKLVLMMVMSQVVETARGARRLSVMMSVPHLDAPSAMDEPNKVRKGIDVELIN